MSNLTVSSAVFDLLQATDQAGMQAAIGAGAPPFALAANDNVVTVSGQPAVALDGDGNPYLAQTTGDQHAEFYFDNNGNPAISNEEGQYIFQVDGNGNPIVQGGDTGDQVGFSSGGVASVTATADGLQLPIGRVVAQGSISLSGAGTINPGSVASLSVSATGYLETDGVILTFDAAAFGWSGTGGVPPPWVIFTSGGNFNANFFNTDLTTGYSLSGNMYYKIIR